MSPFLLLLIAVAPGPAPVAWEGSPAAVSGQPPAAGDFDRRLIALELALSSVVSERPNLWRFDGLETEAAELLRVAPDEDARRSVRDLADRLDRFARIAARHRAARDEQLVWRSSAETRASASRVAPPVRLTKSPAEKPQGHDAVGVLRPVVSKRPDAPKYAVVDDQGRLATLVTPAPAVAERFDGFVGKRVALDGRRGFLTDLKRDHLVAERVTPLRR